MSGTVVDSTQAVIAGARIKLTRDANSAAQETTAGSDGKFSFTNLLPGLFQLTITANGFAPQTSSGNLQAGETRNLLPITLAIAKANTDVLVSPGTNVEVAEEQIKVEEQQRVLKVIPNFYVSYVPNAAPLIARQKFQLAWKTLIDPISFLVIGAVAGVQQSQNSFPGYGQGAQGYAKRYAASYGDLLSGTMIGSAILPSLLKQDPRYFYKGTGSKRSRALYALANAVICKGDNGHWQTNYSGILGSLAAGGLSNLYYPA
ncbi:MAG TPA: carboxypeptidase-like regulatory domain-containing protein, partial [Terriglobales bacterium]|nr:carboxypeptidase-like regulatory domain-containing protein [Terriglobales bacterium]